MSDAYKRVLDVIDSLLGPGGCPWDQKQTVESLCDYILEESYELVEAIRSGDAKEAAEELGDVNFLLLFIATLYERKGDFTLADAMEGNAAKMIRRHPHVFAETKFDNQEELLANWERIKREEKKDAATPKGVMDSVPSSLPPMLRAYRLHSKAARIGFTWENDADLDAQIASEQRELQEALDAWDGNTEDGPDPALEHEFGDYLFSLIEWGRRRGLKANAALHKANHRFLARFQAMEEMARERGLDLPSMSLADQDKLWQEAKVLLHDKEEGGQ